MVYNFIKSVGQITAQWSHNSSTGVRVLGSVTTERRRVVYLFVEFIVNDVCGVHLGVPAFRNGTEVAPRHGDRLREQPVIACHVLVSVLDYPHVRLHNSTSEKKVHE